MQIVLNLVHSSLLRPKEVAHIKIEHVNLQEKYIRVTSDVAKNHNERMTAMTDKTIELIKKLNIEKYPKNFYLLGCDGTSTSGFVPNKQMSNERRYGKNWAYLRDKLDFPQEMQLYSLRDTGIYEMLKNDVRVTSVVCRTESIKRKPNIIVLVLFCLYGVVDNSIFLNELYLVFCFNTDLLNVFYIAGLDVYCFQFCHKLGVLLFEFRRGQRERFDLCGIFAVCGFELLYFAC